MTTRRAILEMLAVAVPFYTALRTRALAAPGRDALDDWARNLVALNHDLSTHKIGLTVWQDRVAALNTSVPVNDIVGYLDIDRLTAGFIYPDKLAQTADPQFPATVDLGSGPQHWFIRVFGMKRGGAVIPHAHNDMVSAHLVVNGRFHARTFNRMHDLADAIAIRPSMDRTLRRGEIITMSDDRDNLHWLVAEEDRSMTFDVGVVDIDPARRYAIAANKYHMIYVDPTVPAESDGLIHAPVITFEQSAAKFAA